MPQRIILVSLLLGSLLLSGVCQFDETNGRTESLEEAYNDPIIDKPLEQQLSETWNDPLNAEHIVMITEEERLDDASSIHTDSHKETIDSETQQHKEATAVLLEHDDQQQQQQQPTFTIEQLRTLLQTLEEKGKEHTTTSTSTSDDDDRSWKSSDLVEEPPDDLPDDRTLLDIFGEAAKQFLTQQVIPETNPECKWDWRSLNCEPICECEFHFKLGDYHLGRSCRIRTAPRGVCHQSVDPRLLVAQTTLSQRVGWMLQRTWTGVRRRYQKNLGRLQEHSLVQWNELQHRVCSELWELLYNQEQKTRNCWAMIDVPSVSITQRLLCGPLHFPLCDDFVAESMSRSECA